MVDRNGGTLTAADFNPETLPSIPQQQKAALTNAASLAQDVAKIVRENGLSKSFKVGGKEHVFVEGWLTISRVNNEAPHAKVERTFKDEGGNEVIQARAWITDASGAVVSEADGYCSNEEGNWKGKPFYARASMAQTRAIGKAMRLRHAWVMVMAGFSPTPVEEMDGLDDLPVTPSKVKKNAAKAQTAPAAEAPAEGAPEPAVVVDTEGMELVHVKAINPNPKKTSRGGFSYGVLLETSDGEKWWNSFSKTVYDNATALKGKNAFAKFEQNGEYINLVELVSAENA